MNIAKLREEWMRGNPKVFRFKSICGFLQFCWVNKLTPCNSSTAYDAENDRMYLVRKEYENEFIME